MGPEQLFNPNCWNIIGTVTWNYTIWQQLVHFFTNRRREATDCEFNWKCKQDRVLSLSLSHSHTHTHTQKNHCHEQTMKSLLTKLHWKRSITAIINLHAVGCGGQNTCIEKSKENHHTLADKERQMDISSKNKLANSYQNTQSGAICVHDCTL